MATEYRDLEWPSLSLKERERRFALAKDKMTEMGLEALIVEGGGFDETDAWFTNDSAGGTVVFPLRGEPTYIVPLTIHGITATEVNRQRGIVPWVEDYQAWDATTTALVTILRAKGLQSAKIGHVGHRDILPDLAKQLPDASFVDFYLTYCDMLLVKSEEELALARYVARIGDAACEAMYKAVKPGTSEHEVYAAIAHAIHLHGAHFNLLITQTGTGFPSLAWGPPLWRHTPQHPPIIGEGDLVQAEIFPHYGGIQTQQQMTVATKPVSTLVFELAEVARRSYEAGLNTLRPGVRFADVCQAMNKPLEEAGCWNLTPLIHSLNPLILSSPLETKVDEIPELKKYRVEPHRNVYPPVWDYVLKAGMMFELEPNAVRDNQRVNLGGTVVVTKDGAEELNTLSTRMRIAE